MKNSQAGFIKFILKIIFLFIVICIGAYFYFHNKPAVSDIKDIINKTVTPAVTKLTTCQDFGAFSNFVLKNIEKPDSQKEIEMNKYVISSFLWKRNADEPNVAYPIIRGIEASYNYVDDAQIKSEVQNSATTLIKILGAEAKSLGFSTDELNTHAPEFFPYGGVVAPDYIQMFKYRAIFGYRKGTDLYSIVIKSDISHQAPPDGSVTVACGIAPEKYDSFYDSLNLKTDKTVANRFDDDYVAISDISPDDSIYALLGSTNHIKIADYYTFIVGIGRKISSDSYPIKCKVLGAQSVGKGMRCTN